MPDHDPTTPSPPEGPGPDAGPLADIEAFWDADAATYDNAGSHAPSPFASAAWARTLERLLPPSPSRVLDIGAGTGFLTLLTAGLGHRVTALDLSAGMLERLRAKAGSEGVDIETVQAPAHEPPDGDFDAVIERHVVWTLPDPEATLARWRKAAPTGRLILFESAWGAGAQPSEAFKAKARQTLRRLRRTPSAHHGAYPSAAHAALPYGSGIAPGELVELAKASGWPGCESSASETWSGP